MVLMELHGFSEGGARVNDEILIHLQGITAEEQAILDGRKTIDRNIYMQGRGNIINAKKLLAAGKLITIRPHTRFIHFPEHTHDYVEVVYMCARQPGCANTDGKTRELSHGTAVPCILKRLPVTKPATGSAKNFILFHCPLDGEQFTPCWRLDCGDFCVLRCVDANTVFSVCIYRF